MRTKPPVSADPRSCSVTSLSVHDEARADPRAAGRETLQIFAALLVFVAVLVAGSLILVVAALTLGPVDSVLNSLLLLVIAAAGCLAFAYLSYRTHRP